MQDTLRSIDRLKKMGVMPCPLPGEVVYKYVSYAVAEKIIRDKCLLFSLPVTFNDPFDLTEELFDFSGTGQQFKQWINNIHTGDKTHREEFIRQLRSNPGKFKTMVTSALQKQKANLGICCFSRTFRQSLMWSHYADKHAGVCLGFAYPPSASSKGFFSLTVRYLDKIIPMNYLTEKNLCIFNWIFSKSKVWEYEQEVRAVYFGRHGLVPFSQGVLREVYYGLRTTQIQKKAMAKLLEDGGYPEDIPQFEMEMNAGTFDIREKRWW